MPQPEADQRDTPTDQNFLNVMQFFLWKILDNRILAPPSPRGSVPRPTGNPQSAPDNALAFLRLIPVSWVCLFSWIFAQF